MRSIAGWTSFRAGRSPPRRRSRSSAGCSASAAPSTSSRRSCDGVSSTSCSTCSRRWPRSRCVVLSVEDVDSADPSTLEFLGALLQRNGLMMLVLLTGRRPVTGLPEPDDILELGGLDASHAAVLARLVGPNLDEPAIEKIVEPLRRRALLHRGARAGGRLRRGRGPRRDGRAHGLSHGPAGRARSRAQARTAPDRACPAASSRSLSCAC